MSSGVGIIVVTRDRADVIPSCLESLWIQIPKPDQIIVVRGSADSFPESLESRFEHMPIRVIDSNEENISVARNAGLEACDQTIALFLDDDATAREGWVAAYVAGFQQDPEAWVAGGPVRDARFEGNPIEFERGVIDSSGRQREVIDRMDLPIRSTERSNVKGCNFGFHRDRTPADLVFDPFFRFAFDESDLVMTVHERGGSVIWIPDAVVDHLHAPGAFRGSHPLDRDWQTEFASHTRFMLKHAHGIHRVIGWFVVIRRLLAHTLRCVGSVIRGETAPVQAFRWIRSALGGVRHAVSSRDSAGSSR